MKKILIILATVIGVYASAYGQVADGINYQAVALDELGKEIAGHDVNGIMIHSKQIAMRFTIIRDNQDGEIIYSETHTTYSDQYGLVSLVIGHGNVSAAGTFKKLNDINWGAGKLFLKVEIDIHNTDDFKVMGIQQMMAVPFAMYALKSSGNTIVNYDDIYNKPALATVATTGDYSDLMNKPFLFDGKYNSLTGKPLIPAKTSELTNDAGFLSGFTENDPLWSKASANYYTKTSMQSDGTAQLHFNNLTNRPTTLAGYGITDAMNNSHIANTISATNISNWNTAYSWGNHAGMYRPVSYVPSWSEITSNPFNITSPADGQIVRYNSASGKWENVTPGFLTAVREAADETTATDGQTLFTLSNTPAAGGRIRMCVNGVTISNTAFSTSATVLTYNSANNGSYVLEAGDRIQFYYAY